LKLVLTREDKDDLELELSSDDKGYLELDVPVLTVD